MSAARYTCKGPGCLVQIAHGRLMCIGHWKQLPREVQRRVNTTWQAYSSNRDHTSALMDRRRYIEAVDAAVAALLPPFQSRRADAAIVDDMPDAANTDLPITTQKGLFQ